MSYRNRILINIINRFWSKKESFQNELVNFFHDKSFYLQGQMDINKKGRWFNDEFVKMNGGYFLINDKVNRRIIDIDPWDSTRRDMLVLQLRKVLSENIIGEMAEVGVYKGYTAKLIHYYVPERKFFIFDTFEGFSKKDISIEKKETGYIAGETWFNDTSESSVVKYISPLNENLIVIKGLFPDSCPSDLPEAFAFVHLDVDLYNPTKLCLDFFYPRMSNGGLILVHDYMSWTGARKAVDEFLIDKKEKVIVMPDKNGTALIIINI